MVKKCVLILVFFVCYWGAFASPKDSLSFKSGGYTMVYPANLAPWKVKAMFSVLFTRLPIDWIEIAADVPIFKLSGKIGLPLNLTLDGSIESVYFSTQVRLGPRWSYSLGRFSTRFGADMAYMFGRMNVSDFNNCARAFLYYPHVAVGFTTRELAFTVVGELNFIGFFSTTSGAVQVSRVEKFLGGRSIGLFLEQKLWKNKVMVLGFTSYFQRFFYPAWPAFSASNIFYFIPQFKVGLVL